MKIKVGDLKRIIRETVEEAKATAAVATVVKPVAYDMWKKKSGGSANESVRLTPHLLRRIIAEELESAMTPAARKAPPAPAAPSPEQSGDDWKKSDPEWVALKKHLGPKEYRRRYTGPESFAMSGWKASWAGDEYAAAHAAFRDVLDTYSTMVGEFALNGEDSEGYEEAAGANDEAVAKFTAAEKAWAAAARPRMRSSGRGQESTADAWARAGKPLSRELLPADAGGPLFHDRGEPTPADRDAMSWSGTRDWKRHAQRRERTPEEHESWLMGGGGK